MLRMPSGRPASIAASPSIKALIGVWDAGLSINAFIDAIAGATLWATRFRGKLNGDIPITTPSGNLLAIPNLFSLPGIISIGRSSPPENLFASSAATENDVLALSTSSLAVLIGLPHSLTSI